MKTELLLPVGNREMALAAIHNGADAIYIGTPKFNARGRSYDFELEELKQIIDLCHQYGVRTHLALNIVIFESELSTIMELLYQIIPLNPDSFIVQDLGLIQLIKKIAPDQTVHASTQMTITNDLAIELVKDLNIKRFVLGRENSLPEIKLIKEKTDAELEVFVHGALCVSYSGQCFTSESLGGRSANRGQCAQSCRFGYELHVDGKLADTKGKSYLVSPQDLCGLNEIPDLIDLGVASFKIEGRLKSPEYVASAANSYREKIDSHLSSKLLSPSNPQNIQLDRENSHSAINKMAIQYSRGFFSGWLHGVNHQKLVDGTFSAHRGLHIGTLVDIHPRTSEITVELFEDYEFKNGDGLLWDHNHSKDPRDRSNGFGSFVFSVRKVNSKNYILGISRDLHLEYAMKGSKLYINHDKELKNQLQQSYTNKQLFKKIPVQYKVTLELNKPLIISITDGVRTITEQTEEVLTEAKNKALTEEYIQEELQSLGGTIFSSTEIEFQWLTNSPMFIQHKSLKNIRQRLTEKLACERVARTQVPMISQDSGLAWLNQKDLTLVDDQKKNHSLQFNILLRDKNQVADLIEAIQTGKIDGSKINSIILDFEFGRDYENSLAQIKSVNIKSGIATTRILKPQEYNNLKIIHTLSPDIILVRNLGALYYFTHTNKTNAELHGDFSLNATNHLTANYLLSKGLKSICASYDLNKQQLNDLISAMPNPYQLEVTIHQTIPSFHMEHCVFAAFLSKGSSYRDCGKPCEKHQVQLKDQFGNFHWIKPDQECRNTMYNAKSQTAARFIEEWSNLGLGSVRFEALFEKGDDLISKIQNYIELLNNTSQYEEILPKLSVLENYGLFEGSLTRNHEYQSRKKNNLE